MSVADEIKKFKDLLDMGAITQEEFEERKRKLLSENLVANEQEVSIQESKQSERENQMNEAEKNEEKIEENLIKTPSNTSSNSKKEKEKKPNIFVNFLRYFFGIIFIISGIPKNIFSILLGISLLPKTYELLEKTNNNTIKNNLKGIAVVIPFVLFILTGILAEPTYIKESNLNLGVGQNYSINYLKKPENYKLESSDEEVASVENDLIIAKKDGKVKIKLLIDGKEKDAVNVVVKYLELTDYDLNIGTTLDNGSVNNISINTIPENASNKEVSFTSSDNNIVSIENEQLICKNVGECIIKGVSYNNIEKEYHVTVINAVTGIELNSETCDLYAGDTKNLSAKVIPNDATVQDLVWTSSNENVVSVDNGNITALSMGTATITVASNNGITDSCIVNVKEKAPITINNFKYTIDYVGGVEWTFNITNNTDKTINYINLKWNCYNGVGDPIRDQITGENFVGLQYTGPLGPHKNTGTKRNMTKFYNSNYKQANITYVEVIYDDGTNKVMEGANLPNYEGLLK